MMEARFLARGRRLELDDGTYEWRRVCGGVGCLLDGEASLHVDEECLARLGRGALPGLVSSFSGIYDSAFHRMRLQVAGGCSLYVWTRESFEGCLSIYQELAVEAIRQLSVLLRGVNRRALRRGSGPLEIAAHDRLLDAANPLPWAVEGHDPECENALMQIAFRGADDVPSSVVGRLLRRYEAGSWLFREGEYSTELYLVCKGRVGVYAGPAGAEKSEPLAVLGPGEFLGEMSHFDDLPRSASAKSLDYSELLVFTRRNFSLIFQLHPKWTLKLVQTLAARIVRSHAGR